MSSRTYLNKPLGDTEFLLEQWGRWRKEGMGLPRLASAHSGPSDLPSACITDDIALAIDAAVSKCEQYASFVVDGGVVEIK